MSRDCHGQVTNISVVAFEVPVSSLDAKCMLVCTGDGLVLAITTCHGDGDVLLKPTILQPIRRCVGDEIVVLFDHHSIELQDVLQAQCNGLLRTKSRTQKKSANVASQHTRTLKINIETMHKRCVTAHPLKKTDARESLICALHNHR